MNSAAVSVAHSPRIIALLPGDGIGPELIEAIKPLLTEFFPDWHLREAEVGWSQWCKFGNALPAQTLKTVHEADATLFAAITSKPAANAEAELAPHLQGTGLKYQSPIVQLRRELDLYANIRPIHIRRNQQQATDSSNVDFVVVRENTEGLYGHDLHVTAQSDPALWNTIADDTTVRSAENEVAVALRVTTLFGWKRLLSTAAKLARQRRQHVTVADKPNILRESGSVIRRAMEWAQSEFPEVTFEFANADVVAMHMITQPERFDVIAAENFIGDMLSDLGAGLMGGLGLATSANTGATTALFEPVHGSAPDIAGQGVANPAAMLLAVAMCAEYLEGVAAQQDGSSEEPGAGLGSDAAVELGAAADTELGAQTGGNFGDHRAALLRHAVATAIDHVPTPDMGGSASTRDFVNYVTEQLRLA